MEEQHGAPWLLVVGAHRSGTSAVTGALGALGFGLPRAKDRMDWPESNPEHWESLSLSLHNEALLERMGGTWEAPPDLPAGWTGGKEMRGLRNPNGLLTAAFTAGGPSVWKDPRICLLLDYWRDLLSGPLAAVLVWRAPLAVARSLHQRDQIDIFDGLALWERYNRAALAGLSGLDTYVVPYESIVAGPKQFVDDVAGWLGSLDQFAAGAERWDREAAAASIDEGLRHQTDQPSDDNLVTVSSEQRQLAERLASLGGGRQPLDPGPSLPESACTTAVVRLRRGLVPVNAELTKRTRRLELAEARLESGRHELERINGELERVGRELERVNAQLAATEADLTRSNQIITNMRGSTSWRMTKPMRSVASLRHGPGNETDRDA